MTAANKMLVRLLAFFDRPTRSAPAENRGHLMGAPEIAAYLSTSERHARRLLYDRAMPVVKIGGLLRVWSTDLDRWLDERTRPAASEGTNR